MTGSKAIPVLQSTSEDGSRGLSAAPRMQDLYGRFLDYLDVRPKTVQTYSRALRQLAKFFEEQGITRPEREDLLFYRDRLRQSKKPATVQNYMTVARLFFRWTEQEGIYRNVADRIKGATVDRSHKKDALTSAQVRAVLDKIPRESVTGRRDFALLALMVTGGLRAVEVSRADCGDLRTLGDGTVLFLQGKGRDEKADYIKIAPEVELALRSYRQVRGPVAASDPLFASESNRNCGGRLSVRSVSRIVKGRLIDAGLGSDRITAHSLRHTAVTLSLLGGKTLQEAQQFARHSNIATTQIYAHNLERAANDCEGVIAAAIFSGGNNQ